MTFATSDALHVKYAPGTSLVNEILRGTPLHVVNAGGVVRDGVKPNVLYKAVGSPWHVVVEGVTFTMDDVLG